MHDFAPVGYPGHPLAAFLPQGFPPIHPAHAGFPLAFAPPLHHPHALDRAGIDSDDRDSKDSLHQQQLHQLHKQHQMFLEEQAAAVGAGTSTGAISDDGDDLDDEDEDHRRNEEDDRCDRRSSDGEEKDQDKEQHHHHHNELESSTIISPPMHRITKSPLQRFNGSENSNSPPNNMPVTPHAPLDLTPRASSTPASGSSTPISPQHPAFGMFAGILQTISAPGVPPNAISPGPAGIGPLASLTTRAAAATSTYNPLGLAVGGSAGMRIG